MSLRRALVAAACLFAVGPAAYPQGNPTGTIYGNVVDTDGLVLAGVRVSAQSPALQGVRTAETSSHGDYVIAFLPPGEYLVSFELQGFRKLEKRCRLAVAANEPLNGKLAVAGITELVTVSANAGAGDFTQTNTVATSYKADLIDQLPLSRSLNSAVLLAPGTSDNGPSAAVVMSGAMSFENLFLIDGVVVNETLRSQARDLYIADAVEETKTSTGSISAEFGRFAGGVVNTITKSGGNEFSGSFRATVSSDKWRALTPYEKELVEDPRVNARVPTFEATFGGPIFKDKLWFFLAGRARNDKDSRVTRYTELPYEFRSEERRYESKLTYAMTPRHTLKATLAGIARKHHNTAYDVVMDKASLYDNENPERLISLNYSGILSSKLFVESQYSRREMSFIGVGSRYTDLVRGTMILDRSRSNARWNSPTFCAVCGVPEGELNTEHRDNQNVLVKASYFLSTGGLGAHTVVAGFDGFENMRRNNNYQSGSSYRVYATNTIVRGSGENTVLYPVFDKNTRIYYLPLVAESRGSEMWTYSGFFNDTWRLGGHWTFNLGARYDRNVDTDQSGYRFADDSAWSPRLAATFDPKGDGAWTINAGFGRYVTAITQGMGDDASSGGRAATYRYDYLGPAVNADPNTANPVPVDQALRTLFDWFNANGGASRATRDAPSIPGITTKVAPGLRSPHADETTFGVSRRLGARGLVRVDGVQRQYRDFYSLKRDTTTGKVADSTGRQYDLALVVTANDVKRSYKALNFQASYRLARALDFGGNYTLSQARGSFNGETANDGPVAAEAGSYPEYRQQRWNYPVGDLSIDQRHKTRLWLKWTVPMPKATGKLNLSVLQRFDSGQPYSADGTVKPAPYVQNPGYLTPPASVGYYFRGRGSERTDDVARTDLALYYSFKLRGIGDRTRLFFRGTVLNVFNADAVVNPNESVFTNDNYSRYASFNPFTETPVEGVNWEKGPDYGKAISAGGYQMPRTLDFSVGLRF